VSVSAHSVGDVHLAVVDQAVVSFASGERIAVDAVVASAAAFAAAAAAAAVVVAVMVVSALVKVSQSVAAVAVAAQLLTAAEACNHPPSYSLEQQRATFAARQGLHQALQ